MIPEDLPHLVEGYAAGTLPAAVRAELATALSRDQRLREGFVRQLRALRVLDAALHPTADANLVRRVDYLIDRSRDSQAMRTIRGVQQHLSRKRRKRSRAWIWSVASAACVSMLIGLALMLAPPARAVKQILTAQVEGATQLVRDGASVPLSDGSEMRDGDRVKLGSDGQASLLWNEDGTRIVISNLGDLTILDTGGPSGRTEGKRLRLDAGELQAAVSRQPTGRPLVILTPHATTTVVGTQFRLYGR